MAWGAGIPILTPDAERPRLRSQNEYAAHSQQANFDGKLRALAAFLQSDIRYVAIEIGIGATSLNPASDIFSHRYGDCRRTSHGC